MPGMKRIEKKRRRVFAIYLLPTPVLTGSGSTGSPGIPASQAPRTEPPQGLKRKLSLGWAAIASALR